MKNIIKPGEIFEERYEILEVLGSGGVGTVYKARQADIGRIVALKILHGYIAFDDEYKARLTREAQVLNTLEHANIVTVYALAMAQDGTPYLVMEYLEGKSLRAAINSERLPVLRSLKIIGDAARALAFVHKNNIVHRDLKPENIFLSPFPAPDTVKILDFGLARLTDLDTQKLTSTGLLVGTPAYMSPEQCEARKCDFRSDIYSLTACLYELLTGTKPFDADTPIGVMYKQRNEPIPSIKPNQVAHFDPKLNELISRGMCKNPEHRHKDMAEFADDIDALSARISSPGRHFFKAYCSDTIITIIQGAFLTLILAVPVIIYFTRSHYQHPQNSNHRVLPAISSSNQRIYRDAHMTMNEMSALAVSGCPNEAISTGKLWLEKYSRSADPEWVSQLLQVLSDIEKSQIDCGNAYKHAQESIKVIPLAGCNTSERMQRRAMAFDFVGIRLEGWRRRKTEIRERLKKRTPGSKEYQKLSAELQSIEALPENNGLAAFQMELDYLATLPASETWVPAFKGSTLRWIGLCEHETNRPELARKHLEEALLIFNHAAQSQYGDFNPTVIECHGLLGKVTDFQTARAHLDTAIRLLSAMERERYSGTKHSSGDKIVAMLAKPISISWMQIQLLAQLKEKIILDATHFQFDHSLADVKQALDYLQTTEAHTSISSDRSWCATRQDLFDRIYDLGTRQMQVGKHADAKELARLLLSPEHKRFLSEEEIARWKALLKM